MPIGAIIIGDEIMRGKRQDKHLAQLISILRSRGLTLAWCQYLGDSPELITATLKRTFAGPDIVFSFGGIGATPDDHTRACAAETEHDVRTGERAFERRRDQFGAVAQVLAPGEREAAAAQNGDQLRQVLVLALAAHDLIADDNGADRHLFSPWRFLLGRNRLVAQLRQPRQAIVDESEPAINRRNKPEQWNQPEERQHDAQ